MLSGAARRSLASAAASASDVARFVDAFRRFGHKEARWDPLGLPQVWLKEEPSLSLAAHEALRAAQRAGASVSFGPLGGEGSVEELEARARATYCGTIGLEFEHCADPAERAWWAERAERGWGPYSAGAAESPLDEEGRAAVSRARLVNAARLALQAETFELFLERKFPSLKRYSGEGAEGSLVALETLLEGASRGGVRDVVIGMPHRGRLAFLVTSMRYSARKLFRKLQGKCDIPRGVDGLDDVSSHVACSVDRSFGGASVHVSLLHNPSHLEAVDPVAVGKTRAKRDQGSASALCVLAHGDAAFCGQGVVAETLAMHRLPGYSVGGSVHVVVNNHVGFTATAAEGRSSVYASDVAKGAGLPVLHVNGEDATAVMWAAQTALEYRARFSGDVVLDVVGWRKHGHNEVDEPSFTQPTMYDAVRARASIPRVQSEQLMQRGWATQAQLDEARAKLEAHLEAEFKASKELLTDETGSTGSSGLEVVGDGSAFAGRWAGFRPVAPAEWTGGAPAAVDAKALLAAGAASVATPPAGDFEVHPRLLRAHVQPRREAVAAAAADAAAEVIDWATAEAMAFGATMLRGADVRLAGQDSRRGTFSHRHATLVCQKSDAHFAPLNAALAAQAGAAPEAVGRLHVVSSLLSEFGGLGFEYGYSLESPRPLVIWEAQFGDFLNGAQIIVDQFLANGETKWLRQSGLVLLLPHEFAGAGPEHSSCRLERFLQATNSQAAGGWAAPWAAQLDVASGGAFVAADRARQSKLPREAWDDAALSEAINMCVANPTTPAQYFHLLMRQVAPPAARPFRKPLVIAAPKTLLKLRECRSSLRDLATGAFQPVLDDPASPPARDVQRVILCSGRIFYLLDARRTQARDGSLGPEAQRRANSTAILRVEELAPFPTDAIRQLLAAKYPAAARLLWTQEEPANAGAWAYARDHLQRDFGDKLSFIGRPALAASAVGVSSYDKAQFEATVLKHAF